MGKAGILTGHKGDIMLATAHVFEGTSHNYIFENDLQKQDFDPSISVYTGPMVTVLGTSLQNRDVLKKFQQDWKTVGLEMEGGHYQLYNLASDEKESRDLFSVETEIAEEMKRKLVRWNQSVERSIAGEDYPGGRLTEPDPEPIFWMELPGYEPYFEEWKKRPEYKSRLANRQN